MRSRASRMVANYLLLVLLLVSSAFDGYFCAIVDNGIPRGRNQVIFDANNSFNTGCSQEPELINIYSDIEREKLLPNVQQTKITAALPEFESG